MVELVVAAVGLAERVLVRYLERGERRLRMKKLELEIDELISRQRSQFDSQALRESTVAEIRRVVAQIPQLAIVNESGIHRGEYLVTTSVASGQINETETLAALRTAVQARRTEILPGTETTRSPSSSPSSGWVASSTLADPRVESQAQRGKVPVSPSTLRGEAETLADLQQRIRARRESDS